MAYIGKTPIVGNFQKCDAITVVNGQAAYTLQVSSTNVIPESSSHMLVSLNGILQAPVTSFTVSGATLTFASNLATGDVIDFVILLGNVLDLGTPSDDTVTLAKMASGTDGNIISYDTSGNPVAVATGTDGQVLTSSGAGAVCAFEDASNVHVLLGTSTITGSTATVDFTSNINSTYKNYLFTYTDVRPITDDASLQIRYHSASGSPVSSGSKYTYSNYYIRSTTSAVQTTSSGDDELRLGAGSVGNATAELLSGQFILHNPAGTDGKKLMHGSSTNLQGDEASILSIFGGAYKEDSVAITGVQFLFSSGNIAKGIFKFYGIK